ncbi:MAG: hypothetical protein ACYDAP_09755 [Thermoplasmataceae archaeon]
MKRNLFTIMIIATMMIVPAVATAAVMVNDTVSVSVSNTAHNSVYLEKGTGYKTAHSPGYFTVVGNNKKYSNLTLDINDVNGTGNMSMTNVLELTGSVAKGTYVNVTITPDLPSGTYLYSSLAAPSTISSKGVISGVNLSTSTPLTIKMTSGTVTPVYFSFLVLGGSKGTGSMTLSYSVTS